MAGEFGATLMIVVTLLLVVLAVMWVVLPLALIGTKPILREIVRQQQRTNELLQQQIDNAKGR